MNEIKNSRNKVEILEQIDDRMDLQFREQLLKEDYKQQGIIISGYPNTLVNYFIYIYRKQQALFLQENQIIPEKFYIFKSNQTLIQEQLKKKIEFMTQYQENEKDVQKYTLLLEKSYTINLNDTKEILNTLYTEISTANSVQSELINQINLQIQIRNNMNFASCPPRILIIRPKKFKEISQLLQKEINNKFDLVSINCSECLNEQIKIKSEIGKFLLEQTKRKTRIPDDIVCSIIKTKMMQVKSQNYGWVIEGFPQSKNQFNKFLSWKLLPTLVILLSDKQENFEQKATEEMQLQKNEIQDIMKNYYHMINQFTTKLPTAQFMNFSLNEKIESLLNDIKEIVIRKM